MDSQVQSVIINDAPLDSSPILEVKHLKKSFGDLHVLKDISFDRFPAVIVAFSINYAAYFAEIFRGGIQSIPKGQYEAAAMLGLTRGQTFYRIILPQVVKRVVPASANEVITLVKDTSLAQVIAVTELFALAKKQQAAYASIYPLFVAGVFYYIANLLLSVLFAYVERKLNYYK